MADWGKGSGTHHERDFLVGPIGRYKDLISALRVFKEFIYGYRKLHWVGPSVTVFGSARFGEDNPYYELAREVGNRLAASGVTVITGGGPGRFILISSNALDFALLYEETVGITILGPMIKGRRHHTSTTLQSGKVLIAGGEEDMSFLVMSDAELFEPGSGFAAAPSMITTRMRHTATLLDDGRVFLAGGTTNGVLPTDSSEFYLP